MALRRGNFRFSIGTAFFALTTIAIVLAQVSNQKQHIIHRRFPPGHAGYPGGYSQQRNWGWPYHFLATCEPAWGESRFRWNWNALAVDAALAVIMVALIAGLVRLLHGHAFLVDRRSYGISTKTNLLRRSVR